MDFLDELKQHIAHGEAVIVVGSGVTIQATNNAPCASWTGLLEDGVDYALQLRRLSKKDAATIRTQIRSNDLDLLLGAAHTVTAKLGSDFGAWLRRSVGELRAIHRDVLEPLANLGILATTNYDHLLTEVTGLAPVPWTDEAAVEQVLRGRRKGILHLHGSYDDPESVILDVKSYQRLVESEHSQAVLTAIRTLKTLVFVGCGEGLSDPHFATFFKWTAKAFEKSIFPHFILCRRKDETKIRKQHLPESKLHPVPYGKEYAELAGFLASLAPPSTPPRKTLPSPGPCFGRADEVRGIVDALLAGPAHIAVLGTAGLGKTTLTLKALQDKRIQERYGDAMYFIRCDAATSADGLIGAIATELGVTGTPQLARAIIAMLRQKPSVLVLDNFETPWQAATLEVEEFLASLSAIDSLQLIVTLRGKERPAGVLWRDPVEPPLLALPAAREAFLAIAGSKFKDDPQLDALLETMDRLPLAISLLAYVAQSEPSLETLMERWQKKRTALLKRAGGKQRLTNFEVSFELSIASPRVTPEALRLLSVLAVLPAGIAHRDLGKVFEDGDEVASVLRATGLAFDEGGRLRMLAPLRAYVGDHYKVNEEDEERFAEHYTDIGEQINVLGRMSGGDSVLNFITQDAANIAIAMERMIERGEIDRVGLIAEAYSILITNTGVGSVEPLLHLKRRAESTNDAVNLANALFGLGNVALWSGRTDSARDDLQQALKTFRELKSTAVEVSVLDALGHLEDRLGNYDEAAERFEEVLALCKTLGVDRHAIALMNVAHIDIKRSLFDSAKKYLQEALPLLRESKMIGGEAFCIFALGRILAQTGSYEEARARCNEALAIFLVVGDVLHIGTVYAVLAEICSAEGDLEGAIRNWQQALAQFARLGDLQFVGDIHYRLALFVTDPAQRAHHLVAARAAWISIGRDDLVAQYLDDEENHPTAN